MNCFAKTRAGLIGLAHVSRIEELRVRSGARVAALYGSNGRQLGVLPEPYEVPRGFIEAAGVPPYTLGTATVVLSIWVPVSLVARIAPAADGAHDLFDADGQRLGTTRATLDHLITDERPAARRRAA